MTCPNPQDWDLLATEALEATRAERMLAHARTCPGCRILFEEARQAHVARVRMYEAFDREHDVLRDQLMAALPAEMPRASNTDRLARGWHRLGDYIMSINKTASRRVAAVLVPAACIALVLVIYFAGGGEKNAFAAALERVRQARTIVCHVVLQEAQIGEGPAISGDGRMCMSADYGSRMDINVNGAQAQTVYVPRTGPMICVVPPARMWMELDISDLPREEAPPPTPAAWLQQMKELRADAAVELGPDTIDGQAVLGFEVPGEKLGIPAEPGEAQSRARLSIWVAEASGLPVRINVTVPVGVSDDVMSVVMDQFEWDALLEAALFEPEIPPGFAHIEAKYARPSEETLLAALAAIGDLTGGHYPTALTPVHSVLPEIMSSLASSGQGQMCTKGQEWMTQFAIEIGSGCQYYMKLVQDGREPEYFGADVTAADADEILLRWNLEDGQMRVVYGDLRVETVPGFD